MVYGYHRKTRVKRYQTLVIAKILKNANQIALNISVFFSQFDGEKKNEYASMHI